MHLTMPRSVENIGVRSYFAPVWKGVKMSVAKIPIEKRLRCLKEGYASDENFYFFAIRAWMNVPMVSYLGYFEKERKRLYQLLELSEEAGEELRYKEVALMVYDLWQRAENRCKVIRIMEILLLLFRRCYEERKVLYGRKD